MNKYQQQQYELAYERDFYFCFCGQLANQQAHLIPNSVMNRKRYGAKLIGHHSNIRSVCSLEHNKKVEISDNKPESQRKQIKIIKEAMK